MATITLQALLETELVVVGSRAQPRSVTESPVPIDAIPLEDVISQGSTTLDYQLRTLVPSFNVATHPISDAATLVRPASLRNLAHDHTLVLVNGKRFEIGAGGRPSWEVGPYAAQGFVSGSNGFPGFPDYTAGAWNRSNLALYGDLELLDPGDRWTVGGALRFEHFDLFGSTTNGKLSARFGLSDAVSVRGGVSTGFRAPTPGQQNTLNVQTTIDPERRHSNWWTTPTCPPPSWRRN